MCMWRPRLDLLAELIAHIRTLVPLSGAALDDEIALTSSSRKGTEEGSWFEENNEVNTFITGLDCFRAENPATLHM